MASCPKCKVPLGLSGDYRLLLAAAGLGLMALILYKGYVTVGSSMLLIGQPIALVAGLAVQRAILNAFPPKLEPYAGHRIWLKLG